MAASRAAETEEQGQARRDGARTRQVASRTAETPEETHIRLDEQRTRQAASRAVETPEQGEARRGTDRSRRSASRAARWTFMEGEAFRYDPANSYDSHPQLYIGQMNNVCSHCNALKWSGEAPGMCLFWWQSKSSTASTSF